MKLICSTNISESTAKSHATQGCTTVLYPQQLQHERGHALSSLLLKKVDPVQPRQCLPSDCTRRGWRAEQPRRRFECCTGLSARTPQVWDSRGCWRIIYHSGLLRGSAFRGFIIKAWNGIYKEGTHIVFIICVPSYSHQSLDILAWTCPIQILFTFFKAML